MADYKTNDPRGWSRSLEVEIGEGNALTALDNNGCGEYETQEEAIAAYLVNAVDTAREYKVSPERTVEAFHRTINASSEITRTQRRDAERLKKAWERMRANLSDS
jgi:hypothetical protein